jgi:aspartate aminotransferase
MAIVQSQSTSCPSSVSQAAAIAALTGPQDIVRERTQAFQRRRDLVIDGLSRIPGLSCRRPAGAFYIFAGYAGVLDRVTRQSEAVASDDAFCRYLLNHANVAVVPGSCFGASPYFRISYAASDDDLREACKRIGSAVAALN